MEKLSEYLDFGKVQLNVLSFEKMPKEEFLKKYKGKIPVAVDHVWFKIQERLRKLGKTENEKYSPVEEKTNESEGPIVQSEELTEDVSESKSANKSARKIKPKKTDAGSKK
jgi:hypothetical protein